MPAEPIKQIVIVGGGTAGWMAASGLASYFKQMGRDVNITLIESEVIGTVGVGEASLPGLKVFNQSIGLNEVEFIRATNASFKLAIQFVDWRAQGETFFHPFSKYGVDIDDLDFHHYWLHMRAQGINYPLSDFSLSTQLCHQNSFAPPIHNPENQLSEYKYAYHFDATLYATLLKGIALGKGVKHMQARIEHVALNEVTGFIESIQTDAGDTIDGQLFIDCSGFKGVLIEGGLHTGYEDWSHWLPCNSAIAIQSKRSLPLTPYTQSIALEAGWRWRIPLQGRVGNGYVYSSEFISDATARAQLESVLEADPITNPRILKFTTGMRKKFWNKNCVALGLAAGFIEPLESTSISLIQTGLIKLLMFFPDQSFNEHLIAEANRLSRLEFERIRDFIIFHYKYSTRDDSEFWRYVRTMDIPHTLEHKVNVFCESGLLTQYENESFQKESWVSLLIGMQLFPHRFDERAAIYELGKLKRYIDAMRIAIKQGAATAPTHEAFLRDNCTTL